MPERKTRSVLSCMRWLLLAVACVVLSGHNGFARQDEQTDAMRILLKSLQSALKDQNGAVSAQTLIQQAGLTEFVTPDAADLNFTQPAATVINQDPVTGQRLDLRLALALIAQSYGSEDTFGVMAAQTDADMKALVIQTGHATMADLRRLLVENHLQAPTDNGVLQLNVPLVIWSGATLDLGPGDRLALNRASGAFLANFGHLDMNGAEISGTGAANPVSPSSQPFVITADGGTVNIRNSSFSHLGFGATLTFAGFSVMRGVLHMPDRQNIIRNSRFQDLVSFATNGAANILIEGNQFRDMRGSSLIIYRTLNATARGNLFTGKMPTNAIRLIEGSAQSIVTGNIVLGGKHAGILIANGSTGAQISHNVIWHRDGTGISILRSDCGTLSRNYVVDNRQKGIEVRVSLDTTLDSNTVLSNRNAGIWVAGQAVGAQTYLIHNVLAANDSGIAGAIGENIHLDGNDFSNQFPQFLSGDLTAQFQSVAVDLHGKNPILLVAANSGQHQPVSADCNK